MMDEEENVGQIIKLTKGSVGIIAVKLIIYCGVRERERDRGREPGVVLTGTKFQWDPRLLCGIRC